MAGFMDSYAKPDSMTDEGPSEESGELGSAAAAAFPEQEWDEARLAALKDLIHLCSQSEYGSEIEDEDDGPVPGKKGPGRDVLALMFGDKSKK